MFRSFLPYIRPHLGRRSKLLRPDSYGGFQSSKIRQGPRIEIIVVIRIGDGIYQSSLRRQSEPTVKIHPARVAQDKRVGIGFHELAHMGAPRRFFFVRRRVEYCVIGFLRRGRLDRGLTLCPAPQPLPAAEIGNHPLPPVRPQEHGYFLAAPEMGLRSLYHDPDMPAELTGQGKRRVRMDNGGKQLGAEKHIMRPKRAEIGERFPLRYAVFKRHQAEYRRNLNSGDGVVKIGVKSGR